MVRRVFFSFHYERDVWRANVVRNYWVKQDREAAGFWDVSLWEEAKKQAEEKIKRMIEDMLMGTSVTAVLIGADTYKMEWVRYEIQRSYQRGNGLLGIYINNIKDKDGYYDIKGKTTFGPIDSKNGKDVYFWQVASIYDWVLDEGYINLGKWVESAASSV
jgi:hypothetical protein